MMLFVFLRVCSDFDEFFSSLKPEAHGATSFYMRGNIDDDDDNEDPCMDGWNMSNNLQLRDRGTLSLQISRRRLSWMPSFPTTEPDDFVREIRGRFGVG